MAGELGTWIFRQLGGDKKELRLEGWDAPFGRPRQKAVVEDGIEIRSKRTYYSGNAPPTRHIFGHQFDDFELSGRFMDRFGGPGYAQSKVEFVKGFVADEQQVALSVGNVISVLGFIRKFQPGRESGAEIPWKMTFEVDEDDLITSAQARLSDTRRAPAPQDISDQLQKLMTQALVPPANQPPLFNGGSSDILGPLIDGVANAFGQVALIAKSMSSFEQSLIGDIKRFRAAIGQLKTAVIIFRDTYQDFRSDLSIESDNAEQQISFSQLQAASSVSTMELIAQIVDADIAAQRAERGKISGFYEAKGGDTWESISRTVYGAADRADDIRLANGIAPGVDPTPGTVYQIPT